MIETLERDAVAASHWDALGREARAATAEPTDAQRRASGWGVCECGHGVERHGRIKPSGNPNYRYVACGDWDCECRDFRASDGSDWPHGPAGVPR